MKTVYFETFGCQMNQYDSRLIQSILLSAGFTDAQEPSQADVIVVNTCSVREHAEERALARISRLARLRIKNKSTLVVTGCMAQRMGEELVEKVRGIDLVVGPDQYRNLPELLNSRNGKPLVKSELRESEGYSNILPFYQNEVCAFVAIMRGCNNYCSYCIVPHVRGREKSRPVQPILSEIQLLLDSGVKEITLLGQNVNSYCDGPDRFPALLKKVNDLSGDFRIRFLTSHPKDLSDELIRAIAESEKVCRHIHLPIQSGSDPVLRAMNRGYMRDQYLEKIRKIREAMPDVSITTDIIAGFPGETEEDFCATLDLVREAQFDEAFTYRYSPRSGTKAALLPDSVSEEEKIRRLSRLILLQREITRQRYEKWIGRTFFVLFSKPASRNKNQWFGTTPFGRPVVVESNELKSGSVRPVIITSSTGATLVGKMPCPGEG